MGIRLIALDIDGTLLDSRSQLPDINRQAIVDATARGIEVVLTTGRRYEFAMAVARLIPCPLTMIVNNGALVKSSDGEKRMLRSLPAAVASRVLEVTAQYRDMAAVCFDRPRDNQMIFESVDWDDPLRSGYFTRNRKFIAEVSPLQSCLTEDPIQVMFTGTVAQSREVEDLLLQADFASDYSLAKTVYPPRDFGMVDVIAPGCSKGATLAEWVRRQGLSPENVMAIGDNLNDREMLEYAGLPIVMGNGVPELKLFGWRETLSNDEGGVAAAIAAHANGRA